MFAGRPIVRRPATLGIAPGTMSARASRAILVESVRVNGEARQKYIAFLGSLTIAQAGSDPDALWFWYRVTKRLDRLGARIGSEDRARISASIAKRVAAADDGR